MLVFCGSKALAQKSHLEKKEELTRIYAPAADAAALEETAAPSEASSTKLDWKAQKEEQARLRKKENELKKEEILMV